MLVCVWLMSMFTYPSKAQNCIVKTSRHLPNNGFLNNGSIWDKPFIKLVSFASTSSDVHLCVFVEAFSLANSWGSLTSFFTCNLTRHIITTHIRIAFRNATRTHRKIRCSVASIPSINHLKNNNSLFVASL